MEKDDRIFDLAIHYALNNSYPATEDLTEYQKRAVRNGFQDPSCSLTYAFEIMSDEFIQVLHNGHDHWLTISTIGAAKDEVFVFDSMYASVSTKVKHRIAALLAAQTKAIKLSFVN